MSSLSANGRRLAGHAIVFNSESLDLGGFTERIGEEALDRTMSEQPDVRALWGHDPNSVLARSSSGTLVYAVDREGLRVSIDTPDTQLGRDTAELVRRGDVNGMSFGFTVLVDDWQVEKGDRVVRTVRDLRLREVSVVSFPAYPAAGVSLNQAPRIGAIRSDATDAGTYSRWNQKTTSPTEAAANALRCKTARLLAAGRTSCRVCKKGVATTLRSDVEICRSCVAALDQIHHRQFNGSTSKLDVLRQRLRRLLTPEEELGAENAGLDRQIADSRRRFESMRPR